MMIMTTIAAIHLKHLCSLLKGISADIADWVTTIDRCVLSHLQGILLILTAAGFRLLLVTVGTDEVFTTIA
jgi:hypothetical protein